MPTAPIEVSVDRLATAVEAPVDSSAAIVEPFRGGVVAARRCAIRGPVEAPVDPVTAPIQAVLGSIAPVIEPLLDAIPAPIGSCTGILRVDLRATHDQTETEPYCAEFHC